MFLRKFGSVIAVLSFVLLSSASIVGLRVYRGKTVMCSYSGLVGVARSCGTHGYERVFTGTIRSAADVGDFDKRLDVQPDEVFLGDSTPLTAITTQACLDNEVKPGEKWLIYLVRDRQSKELVMPYDSPSEPIGNARDNLSLLRRLVQLKDAGILTGTVKLEQGEGELSKAVTDHTILARDVNSGKLYSSRTNDEGFFMFELPAGEYRLSMAPEYHLQETDSFLSLQGDVTVENGLCWEHSFTVKRVK